MASAAAVLAGRRKSVLKENFRRGLHRREIILRISSYSLSLTPTASISRGIKIRSRCSSSSAFRSVLRHRKIRSVGFLRRRDVSAPPLQKPHRQRRCLRAAFSYIKDFPEIHLWILERDEGWKSAEAKIAAGAPLPHERLQQSGGVPVEWDLRWM